MDLSESVQAKYGKKFPIKRPRFRYVEFELSHLTAAEATQVHELDDLLGLTDEVLYVPDPADMAYSQRYGMLGLMSELSPLDYPRYPERAKPYRIEQKL
jgi:hypothetical protein